MNGRKVLVDLDGRAREAHGTVGVAVVTVSDGDKGTADESGETVKEVLKGFGHTVVREDKVPSEQHEVQRVLREAIEDREVDSIILVGGTGLSKGDVTLEAVEPFQEKILPGFGEMLRLVGQGRKGVSSVRTRAVAFVSEGKVVFCLPDSEELARLAASRLIAPELGQMLSESRS